MKLKLHQKDIESIFTKEEIIENLDRVIETIAEFYNDIPSEKFFLSPNDGGWSPEKNVRHLVKATQAIYLGLVSPKFTLIIFGSGGEKSRSLVEIRKIYLDKLNSGSKAGVLFTPIGDQDNADPELQKKIVNDFSKLLTKFKKQISSWEDKDLDNYNMPHPILGNITVREMLLFSIFHLFHHTEKVEARFN